MSEKTKFRFTANAKKHGTSAVEGGGSKITLPKSGTFIGVAGAEIKYEIQEEGADWWWCPVLLEVEPQLFSFEELSKFIDFLKGILHHARKASEAREA